MEPFPRGKAAIVSAATFGIGEMPDYSAIDLGAKAAVAAVAAAGLQLGDIDAVFSSFPSDFFGLAAAEYLGIQPRLNNNNRPGGSAFMTHVIHAANALATGACDAALILYGSNQRSASGKLVAVPRHAPFESEYKARYPISSYALAAARHMHEYGTTREHLAEVAVAARGWANLNPEAFARGPLTIEDCLNARMVSDPLSVQDCCLVTDGAAAIVMTRADRARDLVAEPVYVLGGASATWHNDYIAAMPDLTVTAAQESGARAFGQSGYQPGDVDVLQLYDAFTLNTILFLEDLGFCPKGEGGRFVEGGRIGPGGSLPVNTNGGGLSCVHPGMYGLFAITECVRQLQGVCGERQVPGAKLGIAHGNGVILSNQATLVLGTGDTL
ncbi:thiolase [Novosphingobium sp. BL-52-GroH]|uniref:thiolase n=1 Tax=Novosphingobium sp. BL-52-GroH TaxID=3349877 RepID=UPI00384AB21D